MKKLIIIIIFNILILSPINAQAIEVKSLPEYLTDRSLFVNEKMVRYQHSLSSSDAMTEEQAESRVNSIIEYSLKYHYTNPNTDINRVIINIFSIIETETRFVNYAELDDGLSFGVPSMQWETVDFVKKLLDEPYFDTEHERLKLINDTDEQIRLMVFYYYYILSKNNQDFNAAAIQYNRGHNSFVDNNNQYRNYTFLVKGRVKYIKEQIF